MSDVKDDPAQHRYELEVDGAVAFAEYRLGEGTIDFVHTLVPPSLEGRGVGSRLAQGALADAKARGLKISARCPFIAGYIRRHPEAV